MPKGYSNKTGLATTYKHGLTKDRFHRIWRAIYLRCKDKENLIYGGRGIKNEWTSFEQFKADMYESYLAHVKQFGEKQTSIDRTNNDGNYSKSNCKWATRVEQSNNRRSNHLLTFNGKSQSMADWARELNLTFTTVKERLKRGWSIEKTLTTQRNFYYKRKIPDRVMLAEIKSRVLQKRRTSL